MGTFVSLLELGLRWEIRHGCLIRFLRIYVRGVIVDRVGDKALEEDEEDENDEGKEERKI